MPTCPARTSAELKKLEMVFGERDVLSCLVETVDCPFSSLLDYGGARKGFYHL